MAIHIKPENRGKFNALKKRTGKTTEELTHSKNPLTRKRAVFAQNASRWRHAAGGEVVDMNQLNTYAMGGKTKKKRPMYANGGQVPVEVEGQEVAQTPDGQTMEFAGPSHENGGIPVALPEQTMIFSDRISIDGKSMADRKKARERKLNRLGDLLAPDPTNVLNRNNAARTKMALDAEEQMDIQIQQVAAPVVNKGKRKMAGGGIIGGATDAIDLGDAGGGMSSSMISGLGSNAGALLKGLIQIATQLGEGSQEGTVKNPLIEETSDLRPYAGGGKVAKRVSDPNKIWQSWETQPVGNFGQYNYFSPGFEAPMETDLPMDLTPQTPYTDPNVQAGLVEMYPELSESDAFKMNMGLKAYQRNRPLQPEGEEASNNMIPGNIVGQLGTAVGAVGPLMTTLANRREDKPNINPFLGFGQDALDTSASAESQLAASKAAAMQQARISGNTARMRNRNSASSVNTQRALDSVTDMQTDMVNSQIEATSANQMLNLLTQRAGLQNQRDQVVMGGEGARDLGDRRDRDAFYSNLNRDIGNVGSSLQAQGRTMNQQKYSQDELELMNELSAYGLGYKRDKNGKLKLTKVKK